MIVTGIEAITEKLYLPKFSDNVYNTNPTLAKFKAGEKSRDGGTSINVPLEYQELVSGGSFRGLGYLDTEVNDIATQAQYEWREYYVSLGWSSRDYHINKGSKTQIVNMIESMMKNASKKMQKLLTTGIFQTSKASSDDIDGLPVAITAAGTTDCGGVDSSDITLWAPQRDTTTTKLSLAAMNTQERAASDGTDRTDLWVTTDAIYGYFYDIATPLERLQNKEMGDLGFTSLSFNGKPLFSDKAATDNYLWGLNMDHLWMEVMSGRNMLYVKPQKPLNQSSELGRIEWMGNIVTDARRRQLQFSDIQS